MTWSSATIGTRSAEGASSCGSVRCLLATNAGGGLALADFDGDGRKSVVVGACDFSARTTGLVYALDVPDEGGELPVEDARFRWRGETKGDLFGWRVVSCDTDRDGIDEPSAAAQSDERCGLVGARRRQVAGGKQGKPCEGCSGLHGSASSVEPLP